MDTSASDHPNKSEGRFMIRASRLILAILIAPALAMVVCFVACTQALAMLPLTIMCNDESKNLSDQIQATAAAIMSPVTSLVG